MTKPKAVKLPRRTGVKAIPRTIEAWINELSGCTAFAIKKPYMIDAAGQAWFDGMKGYYLERIAKIAANIPPGMNQAEAKRLLADVKAKLG